MEMITPEEVALARKWLKLTRDDTNDFGVAGMLVGTLLLQRIRMRLAFDRLAQALAGPTEPILFRQANGTLHGNRDTNDLPVARTAESNTVSCWHIPLWKRIKLLWTGNVWLVVKGPTHPPLWIDTEVFWK